MVVVARERPFACACFFLVADDVVVVVVVVVIIIRTIIITNNHRMDVASANFFGPYSYIVSSFPSGPYRVEFETRPNDWRAQTRQFRIALWRRRS